MRHTLANPPATRADFDSNPVFNLVTVYENFEAGKHAKRTYDYLVAHLGSDCEFNNQIWKFDLLGIPEFCASASADAAAADIVVISCQGDALPQSVRAWIDSWVKAENKPWALVALFDGPQQEAQKTRAVRQYLSDVAERAGMEFFAQPEEWPGRSEATERAPFEIERKPHQPALLRPAEAAPRARWSASP